MTTDPADRPEALALVSRIAASLPSLSRSELDELADAVEALTDAIGLQRDWPGEPSGRGTDPASGSDG